MDTTDINKFLTRTSDAVRVLAFFKARPGRGKDLETILLSLVGPTRSEPGNIAYVLHRSTRNPDELVFDEMFVSMKAFEEHSNAPYIRSLESKISHLLEVPVRVETYTEA